MKYNFFAPAIVAPPRIMRRFLSSPLLMGALLLAACDSRPATTADQANGTVAAAPVPATPTADLPPSPAPASPDTAETAQATGEVSEEPSSKEAPATEDTSATKEAEKAEETAKTDKLWPVKMPEPMAGSILPHKRIVAYYGNPLSKRMGILGEVPPEEMLSRLDKEVAAWEKADPSTPVQPALHMVAVTAQSSPGRAGKYRLRMTDATIDKVMEWAKKRDAIVFLDIQVGHSTLQEEVPALEKYLKLPNVHLGVDPEFSMKSGSRPGRRVGTYDAADINYAANYLANLVKEHQLPPKVLVVHRFTQRMITNYDKIKLRPEVQIVMHMDGWGPPELKKGTYRHFIYKEPVQYTGFKLFYHNDTKKGHALMKPEQILKLHPQPVYIQYQ
jgi:hypothetical protein